MTPDTTLNLGNFQFQGLEIPAQISGLAPLQSLAIHKFVGGDRTIDALGQDFPPITWSGLFFGTNAIARLNQLKALAAAGLPQTLLWHSFNYLVLIKDVGADERRQYEIPYHITCEVVSDNSTPVTSLTSTTDAALNADLLTAQTLSTSLNIPSLLALIAQVTSAMAAVVTFASAPLSLIASILLPLSAMQGYLTSLIATTDAVIGSAAGFGGVVVGSDALSMALILDSIESAALEEMELWNLAGIIGRMAANLTSLNGSPNTRATAGGNLFQIAAAEYGAVDDWTVIATANGLTDPFIDGAVVLTIPLAPGDSGGILSN